jgi:predicted ATPase
MLMGVPCLTLDRRNEGRRLITRVDALYDRRVNLVIGAVAAPDALCQSATARSSSGAR